VAKKGNAKKKHPKGPNVSEKKPGENHGKTSRKAHKTAVRKEEEDGSQKKKKVRKDRKGRLVKGITVNRRHTNSQDGAERKNKESVQQ